MKSQVWFWKTKEKFGHLVGRWETPKVVRSYLHKKMLNRREGVEVQVVETITTIPATEYKAVREV